MQRDVQHPRVFVEDVLNAVAVVHVPIQDEHPPRGASLERDARGDRGVVEETETGGTAAIGVVSWRSDDGERAIRTSPSPRPAQPRTPSPPPFSRTARCVGSSRCLPRPARARRTTHRTSCEPTPRAPPCDTSAIPRPTPRAPPRVRTAPPNPSFGTFPRRRRVARDARNDARDPRGAPSRPSTGDRLARESPRASGEDEARDEARASPAPWPRVRSRAQPPPPRPPRLSSLAVLLASRL